MSELINNLNSIYDIKLQIKEVIGTDSDNFTEYPQLIDDAISSGAAVLDTLNVSANGTYTPDGVDGWDEVVVNVPSSGGVEYTFVPNPAQAEPTYTAGGKYSANGKFGIDKIEITSETVSEVSELADYLGDYIYRIDFTYSGGSTDSIRTWWIISDQSDMSSYYNSGVLAKVEYKFTDQEIKFFTPDSIDIMNYGGDGTYMYDIDPVDFEGPVELNVSNYKTVSLDFGTVSNVTINSNGVHSVSSLGYSAITGNITVNVPSSGGSGIPYDLTQTFYTLNANTLKYFAEPHNMIYLTSLQPNENGSFVIVYYAGNNTFYGLSTQLNTNIDDSNVENRHIDNNGLSTTTSNFGSIVINNTSSKAINITISCAYDNSNQTLTFTMDWTSEEPK